MAIISTGLNPSFLLPGATKAFGDAYASLPTTVDRIFESRMSDRAYEELALMSGMQQAKAKDEGSSIQYDTMKQLYVQRALHVTYALGYIVTQEAIDDLKAEDVAAMRSRMLKRAFVWKKEQLGNDILNNAFSGGPTYADGSALCVSTHSTLAGNQSNILSVAAALSEASLETQLINIRTAKAVDGALINLRPTALIIPPALEPTAHRVLESDKRSGTADNDANWVGDTKRIPEVIVSNYLTSTTAWFVKTDADDGLIMYARKPLVFEQDLDFDTANHRFKASERYSFTVGDFRTLFGTAGA